MSNPEFTLSSPVILANDQARSLLTLTIAWHPDRQRVGAQFIATDDAELDVSRYLPLFATPEKTGAALGYGGISRAPLKIVPELDGVTIVPPDSRMVVEVQGTVINGPYRLSAQQIEDGVVLGLGRVVLLCLHWMRCLPQPNRIRSLVGVGSAAIRIRSLICQAAASEASVLLLGETGTGKEVVAQAIHAHSARASNPMVSVNMAALNEALAAADLFGASRGAYTGAHAAREGLFAQAQHGTLFLDEVGNTPAPVQPMLLRILETGEYRPLGASRDSRSNVRLIAATDQDLHGGGFNLALLRRLEGFIIQLPPLRARREDIGVLIVHTLSTLAAAPELPVALVAQLLCYDWPGNVRQLNHVLKRAILALHMGEVPQLSALLAIAAPPQPVRAMPDGAESSLTRAGGRTRTRLADIDERAVLQAMCDNDWYVQGAAQSLSVSRPSMYKLLASHPAIRRPEQIVADEVRAAYAVCAGDVEACAARLQTPTEALRRHLRGLQLLD